MRIGVGVARVGIALLSACTVAIFIMPPLKRLTIRAIIRRRIRQLQKVLRVLGEHAAVTHALTKAYAGKTSRYAVRSQALQRIQRRVLTGLQSTRLLINAELLRLRASSLLGDDPMGVANEVGAFFANESAAEIATELAHAERLLGVGSVRPAAPPPQRDVMLRDEQQAIVGLGERAEQPRALSRSVRALRALESSLDFQAELLAAQRECAGTSGYSEDNFAFGSTPLQSWVALFECEPLREKLASRGPKSSMFRRIGGRPQYLVLGSSLGSLVMYGACVHGLVSQGIELLPLLHSESVRIAKAAGVEGVSFECADMLSCDLSGYEIVLLASQCWDVKLRKAIKTKLLEELPINALVLDYTAALGESEGEVDEAVPGVKFSLACTVKVAVSWSSGGQFWVWRVVGDGARC